MGGRLQGVKIARISTVPSTILEQLRAQLGTLVLEGAFVTVVASAAPEMQLLEELPGVTGKTVNIQRAISPWRDVVALFYLVCLFRRERFSIVHSATPKAGLLSAIAAFVARVPIRIHTFTGQPWVSLRGPVRFFSRWSDWLIGKLNTRCYADSPSQRDFLIEQGVISADSLFVVGYGSFAGVDLARFNLGRFPLEERQLLREELKIPSDAAILLFVGRLTPDKGVRELLAAFSELKARGAKAFLILVGPLDSDSGVAGAISRNEIESLSDVISVGYSDCPERYMAIADILCLPSYREGFGTVVIEAAAMGVPTVGSDIYGLSDAVEHGETGLLVPPKNSSALAEALFNLIQDEPMRRQMGHAAKRRAERLFDAQVVNHLLVDEYRALFSI